MFPLFLGGKTLAQFMFVRSIAMKLEFLKSTKNSPHFPTDIANSLTVLYFHSSQR